MPGFSVVVTLVAGALSWAASRVPTWVLGAAVALAIVLIAISVGVEADLSGGVPVLAFVVAVSGGALIGRVLPPMALAMAIMLGIASLLDVVWIASGATATGLGGYATFSVQVGDASGTLGTLDILLAAAVAMHWRTRGSGVAVAVLAAPIGMVLGNLAFRIVDADNLPLVPFIAAGWLVTELWQRWTDHRSRSHA